MRDPKWNQGQYALEDGPFGVFLWHMMARTYLSDAGLEAKFGRKLKQIDGTKDTSMSNLVKVLPTKVKASSADLTPILVVPD